MFENTCGQIKGNLFTNMICDRLVRHRGRSIQPETLGLLKIKKKSYKTSLLSLTNYRRVHVGVIIT